MEIKPLRIGVNLRGALTGKISGVEQYTLQMLRHLLKVDRLNTYVLFFVDYKDNGSRFKQLLVDHPFLSASNVEVRMLQWPNAPLLLHVAFKFFRLPKIDKVCGGLDVMWLPSPEILPLSRHCPRVTTFHDLIFLIYPNTYTLYSRLWQWQMDYPYQARIAKQIIAVSQSTKNDLVRLTSVDANKIEVIYEGVGEEYFASVPEAVLTKLKQQFQIPEKYLYYVGSLEPRKNLGTVLRALTHLTDDVSGTIKLVISGSKSWLTEGFYQQIKDLGLEGRVIFTGRVEDEQKIALMRGGLAFVFPSLYEGFGLMILEAFAAGAPVITSRVSAMPEVAGDAGILVEPNDDVAIAEAVKKLNSDPTYRADLISKGQNIARRFSWTTAAQKTLSLIQSVAKNG